MRLFSKIDLKLTPQFLLRLQNFFHHHPVIAPDETEDDERQGGGAGVRFLIQFGLPVEICGFVGFYPLSVP